MSGSLLVNLTIAAAFAVFLVLLAGLWNMMRRDSDANLSQKLMRWRIGLQFIAILIAIAAVAVMRH